MCVKINFYYFFFSVLLALSAWLTNDSFGFLLYSGSVILVFRFELSILLGMLLFVKMLDRSIGIVYTVISCFVMAIFIVGKLIYFYKKEITIAVNFQKKLFCLAR